MQSSVMMKKLHVKCYMYSGIVGLDCPKGLQYLILDEGQEGAYNQSHALASQGWQLVA